MIVVAWFPVPGRRGARLRESIRTSFRSIARGLSRRPDVVERLNKRLPFPTPPPHDRRPLPGPHSRNHRLPLC